MVNTREHGYSSVSELKARTSLKSSVLENLARADTFQSLGLDRRHAFWAVKGLSVDAPLPLFKNLQEHQLQREPNVVLPTMRLGEQVADDYLALKLSLKAHPMELLRPHFKAEKYITCASLTQLSTESLVLLAGLVLIRQRPSSAKGVIFITIEDETGVANMIIWPHKMKQYRQTVFGSQLLGIRGKLQREGIVTHVVAERLFDHSFLLSNLASKNLPDPDFIQSSETKNNLSITNKKTRTPISRSRDFK